MTQNVTAWFGMPGFEVSSTEMIDEEWYVGIQAPRDLVGCSECGAVARVKDRRTVTGSGPPGRWGAGGDPVAETHLRVPIRVVPEKDLDREASGDRVPGGPHGPGQAVGFRAGRSARPRRGPGRRAARRRLAHDHAAGHRARKTAGRRPETPRRGDRGRGRRDRVPAGLQDPSDAVRDRHRRSHPGPARTAAGVVKGRSGTVLSGWLAARDENFRAQIVTASLDPFRGYATALAAQLPRRSESSMPFIQTSGLCRCCGAGPGGERV